jgi:hypothetical protein
MPECVEEQTTKHYRGKWCGFGPVQNDETVLFAVFENQDRRKNTLTADSFSKNLNSTSESIARLSYVARATFRRKIVNNRRLAGVASVIVSKIRDMRVEFEQQGVKQKVRSVCIVDRVERGDCQGHATMGYSEAIGPPMTQAYISKLRKKIRMDLAETFSQIQPEESYQWPSSIQVLQKRFLSVRRVLVALRD